MKEKLDKAIRAFDYPGKQRRTFQKLLEDHHEPEPRDQQGNSMPIGLSHHDVEDLNGLEAKRHMIVVNQEGMGGFHNRSREGIPHQHPTDAENRIYVRRVSYK